MPSALLLGGTGQIGLAVANRLAGEGWDVRLGSRRKSAPEGPWRYVTWHRDRPGSFDRALGDGADLLLDCVGFDASAADRLLAVQGRVGHLMVISSASVYRDAQRRTLDEAVDGTGFPKFPIPIPEDCPTVDAGPETYSTRKVAMEECLLQAEAKATVLRPCAIHGPHSKHAREWWFVKRLLDGRTRIPLAYQGRSQFQTTSTAAIAEAVLFAVQSEAPAVMNVADADSPTVREIGQVVMDVMGTRAELVGLPDEPYPPAVGATPWSVPAPMIIGSSAPSAGSYAVTAPAAIDWLLRTIRDRDWRAMLPQLAAYPNDHFDYEAEDRLLGDPRSRSG